MNAHHRSQLQGLFFSLSLAFNSAHKIATCVFPSIFHIEEFKAEETSRMFYIAIPYLITRLSIQQL